MNKELFTEDELTVLEAMSIQGGYSVNPEDTNVFCPISYDGCTVNSKCPITFGNCYPQSQQECGSLNDKVKCIG